MKQQQIIPGILALISCFWLYMAITKYGIWDEGPRGGFMPLLAALLTLGCCLMIIILASDKKQPWLKTVFIPVGLVLALMSVTYIIGLLPALFLMLIGWMRFLEKYSWMFTIALSACVMACVWMIFRLWLNVPFPIGWLGNWLLY